MMKTGFTLTMLMVLALVLCCAPSFGETQPGIDKLVDTVDHKIKTWHYFYWISLISTIIVGMFGLVITLLQSLDQTKYRIYTICLGTVISACTFLSNSFLKGDYREYDRIEQKGILKQIELGNLVEIYKTADSNNQKIIWSDIKSLILEIDQLEDSLTASKQDLTAKLESSWSPIVGTAYAGTAPSWLSTLPEDSNYLFFTGFADGERLEGLEVAAVKNATQNAAAYLVQQFGQEAQQIDADKLAKFLADTAKPYSAYISRDAKNLYRYYSLIRISKNILKTGTQLFGVENNVEIPEALLSKIDVSQRARDDYTSRQAKIYESLEDQAKTKLNKSTYLKFLKARQLRKEDKNYPEAIAMLKEILHESPDFYLGWYNLALASDAMNDTLAADAAYQRAVALESSLTGRDATLYNSYGHFFYKQKKYQDAITQYKKSLSLDPTNPRTQNNISQAMKQLQLSPR
jgi:tetratricopeptide (TPR) repeat protein